MLHAKDLLQQHGERRMGAAGTIKTLPAVTYQTQQLLKQIPMREETHVAKTFPQHLYTTLHVMVRSHCFSMVFLVKAMS